MFVQQLLQEDLRLTYPCIMSRNSYATFGYGTVYIMQIMASAIYNAFRASRCPTVSKSISSEILRASFSKPLLLNRGNGDHVLPCCPHNLVEDNTGWLFAKQY